LSIVRPDQTTNHDPLLFITFEIETESCACDI
jgi:hypothetical protein